MRESYDAIYRPDPSFSPANLQLKVQKYSDIASQFSRITLLIDFVSVHDVQLAVVCQALKKPVRKKDVSIAVVASTALDSVMAEYVRSGSWVGPLSIFRCTSIQFPDCPVDKDLIELIESEKRCVDTYTL